MPSATGASLLTCVRAQVAEVAAWVLFMWLFALSAYDALSGAPKLAWGTPLVVAGVYLILFTLHQGYQDVKELQKDMNKTDEECHVVGSRVAEAGGPDGDGVDEGGADNPEAGSEEQPLVLSTDDDVAVGGCIDCGISEDPGSEAIKSTEIVIHQDDD